MTVIVADLGATNARLAFMKNGRLSDIYQFACDDFKNPEELLVSFMRGYAPDAKFLLAGVPGPVLNGKVCWTNRSWRLNARVLKAKLKLKEVVLMNDLQVQGMALDLLHKQDFVFLQKNRPSNEPKILVNVGTGLGACYLINGQVFASEYGQSVTPQNVSLETDISGSGFKRSVQRLKHTKEPVSAVQVANDYVQGSVIAQAAYKDFYAALARTLMNLALTIKATGGVYFCGGILDENTLKKLKFDQSFRNHPKMKPLLSQMPLIFIRKKDFAFLGLKKLVKKYGWS